MRQLELLISGISMISTEIRYCASPTEAIMEKLNSMDEYKPLKIFGNFEKRILVQRDFEKAWQDSVRESAPSLALNTDDLEAMCWFGRVLGATDVEGQLGNCERFSALLKQRLAGAREDLKKRGRMYYSMGVLTGAFLIILLL